MGKGHRGSWALGVVTSGSSSVWLRGAMRVRGSSKIPMGALIVLRVVGVEVSALGIVHSHLCQAVSGDVLRADETSVDRCLGAGGTRVGHTPGGM